MWTKITEDKATWPPLDGSLVLLCTTNRKVIAGVCENGRHHLEAWMLDEDSGSMIHVGNCVTHWMPLPQPPTE